MRLLPKGTLLLLCPGIVVPFFDPSSVAAYQTTSSLPLASPPSEPTLSSPRKSRSTSSVPDGIGIKNDRLDLYAAAFRRASEIGIILGGMVVAPILLASFTSEFQTTAKTAEDNDYGGWDKFWSTTTSGSTLSSKYAVISHATRLANAIELLGPTYVKFGQALGSRPDVVPPSLAEALSSLQDDMAPFSTADARDVVARELMASKSSSRLSEEDIKGLVSSLSELPVAAASIGQVYEAHLPTPSGQSPVRVAVKVQRPGVRKIVEQDAKMLLALAEFVDSIPAFSFLPSSSSTSSMQENSAQRLIRTQLVPAVREFMSRIIEEMDYRNEARNIIRFANIYSSNKPSSERNKSTTIIPRVVVPEVYLDWCTEY